MSTDAQPERNKPNRPRRLLAGLGISTIAVLLALGGLELFARRTATHMAQQQREQLQGDIDEDPRQLMTYTRGTKRLVPGARVVIRNHYLSGKDVVMSISSQGFRDRELPMPKPESELRVLVLGDSITWGDYLQPEETFVEVMQDRLKSGSGDRAVEVINGGVGGIGLKEEVDLLLDQGLAVDPDLVLVAFYLNDSCPIWRFAAEIRPPGWLRRNSVLLDTLYTGLKLREYTADQGEEKFAWVKDKETLDWRHDHEAFLELARRAEADWGSVWGDDAWTTLDRELGRLKDIAGKNDLLVGVMAFPVSFQVYADFLEDKPQRLIAERARKLGFEFVDFLPLLRRHRDEELFFDHCHPREAANALIGEAAAEFVRAELLPKLD